MTTPKLFMMHKHRSTSIAFWQFSLRRCEEFIDTELALVEHSGFIHALPLEVQLNYSYHLQLEIDIDIFLVI